MGNIEDRYMNQNLTIFGEDSHRIAIGNLYDVYMYLTCCDLRLREIPTAHNVYYVKYMFITNMFSRNISGIKIYENIRLLLICTDCT